jgi:hypothetical protein
MVRNFCCGDNYFIFPDMIHSKNSNPMDLSVTKCYDSRSFYRTFEYQGGTYYKIGEPYIPNDKCCDCCCCCPDQEVKVKHDESCCCCCCCNKEVIVIKRICIDILNMSGQSVGKYVRFFDRSGCCCCETRTLFYEIYFPPDANEILRLALIGHLIFLIELGPNMFSLLGSNNNLVPFSA